MSDRLFELRLPCLAASANSSLQGALVHADLVKRRVGTYGDGNGTRRQRAMRS
jgi:hypothetical protein